MVTAYSQMERPTRVSSEGNEFLQRWVICGSFRNVYIGGYPALACHDNNRWVSGW